MQELCLARTSLEKLDSCSGDHDRIKIFLQANRPQQMQKKCNCTGATTTLWKTQDTEALTTFASQLETELDKYRTREEFMEKCIEAAEETIRRKKKHLFHRGTPWFDTEVDKRIAERKRLSKKHHHIQQNDAAANEAAWKDYIEQKEKVKNWLQKKSTNSENKRSTSHKRTNTSAKDSGRTSVH